MSFIKSNKLGQSGLDREKLLREEILNRWQNIDSNGKTYNLLEGLEGSVKDNIALLYENQARYLKEVLGSSEAGGFESVAFPMVRRVFAKLLANDIVSVQAMTQPTGAIFFFYPNISNRVAGTDLDGRDTESHAPSIGGRAPCELVGSNCPDVTYATCRSLYDRFYCDDLYDHSKGNFTIITASGTPVMLDSAGCWQSASTLALASDNSVREMIYKVTGFAGRGAGSNCFTARMNGSKGYEVDTEEFISSFVAINAGPAVLDPDGAVILASGEEFGRHRAGFFTQKYGYGVVERDCVNPCADDGAVYIRLNLTHPQDCTTCTTFDGYIGAASGTTFDTTDIAFAWRRYDSIEGSTEIGEVTFEIKKETVSVIERALRARWTPQLAMDIQSYHNIDAEAELTALLSEQIAMEIDREILRDLKNGAAWRLRWDYSGWKNQGSQKYTQKEWNQTLITRINQISAQIHKSTLRGGANFVVVSSEVSALFDDLDVFLPVSHDLEDYTYNLGIKQVGTVSGRYKVYVDPYACAGDVLIGHKGTSMLDTGYVYAPYMPLQLTQSLTDPNNFTMVKGIMTRYAKKFVNNRYYGYIHVDRVQSFSAIELR